MGKLTFTERAWEEYQYWQTQDKKTLKRINELLRDNDGWTGRNHSVQRALR